MERVYAHSLFLVLSIFSLGGALQRRALFSPLLSGLFFSRMQIWDGRADARMGNTNLGERAGATIS